MRGAALRVLLFAGSKFVRWLTVLVTLPRVSRLLDWESRATVAFSCRFDPTRVPVTGLTGHPNPGDPLTGLIFLKSLFRASWYPTSMILSASGWVCLVCFSSYQPCGQVGWCRLFVQKSRNTGYQKPYRNLANFDLNRPQNTKLALTVHDLYQSRPPRLSWLISHRSRTRINVKQTTILDSRNLVTKL